MPYREDDEFMAYVGHLIEKPSVQRLKGITHHIHSNRLEHSINVSYTSYKIAKKFGVKDYRDSVYKVDEKGNFTGEVKPMWDAESKQKAISYFVKKYNIDLEKSYAYGDTTGDLTMFKNVGHAIAINPAKKLLEKIKEDENLREKVKIIVERKDVIYSLNAKVEIL